MNQRFLWLDGLRGVAALIVMMYHFQDYLHLGPLFQASYLAVDLFFIMSGFVLAHAYEARLLGGLSFSRFMGVRLIRLYPVYLAATLLGAAYYAVKIALAPEAGMQLPGLARTFALNIVFIPDGDPLSRPAGFFPFAASSWSLAAEIFVSVLYASIIYRLPVPARAALLGFTAAVFLAFALHYGTMNLGWEATSFAPGLFRATAEFVGGAMLYNVAAKRGGAGDGAAVPLTVIALAGVILIAASTRLAVSVAVTASIFPALVVLLSRFEPRGLLARVCHQLGRGSYPVYLLHSPVLLWTMDAAKTASATAFADHGQALAWTAIVLTLLASYACAALFDEPVRAYLTVLIRRRRATCANQHAGGDGVLTRIEGA